MKNNKLEKTSGVKIQHQSPKWRQVQLFGSNPRDQKRKKAGMPAYYSIILSILILAIIGGCAYYNTFYIAKKEFKAAEIERKNRKTEKPTSKENKSYTTAIEKASKVLELYPKSKYVDDALLMLGKCFYFKEQYSRAERKFEELISLYGDGDLSDDAFLWRTKCRKELKRYDVAATDCRELIGSADDKKIIEEAQFLIAEILFAREEYNLAVDEYNKTLEKTSKKEIKYQTYTQLGECHLLLKNHEAAVQAYKSASKNSPTHTNRYNALLKMGEAYKLQGNHEEAVNALNKLLTEEAARELWPDVEYQVAESIYLQGDIDEAIKWYNAILENYPRAEAAAQSSFQLGHIYEVHFSDYEKAKENYDKVKKAAPRSEKVPEATSKSADIAKFLQLKTSIADLEKNIAKFDSTKMQKDALEKAPADTVTVVNIDSTKKVEKTAQVDSVLQVPPNKKDPKNQTPPKKLDINQMKLELGAAYLQLAELYYLEFNKPDSALEKYWSAYNNYSIGDIGSQALYSIAFLLKNVYDDSLQADSFLVTLVEDFPDSEQSDEARIRLNLPPRHKKEDDIIQQIHNAEQALWDEKNYVSAMDLYKEIGDDSLNGEFAVQALFGRAWILENRLFDNEKAYEAYKHLAETYPKSEFTQQAKAKINAYEKDVKAKLDSAAVTDSVGTIKADSLSQVKIIKSDDQIQKADTTTTNKAKMDSTKAATAAIKNKKGNQKTTNKIKKIKKP